MQESNGRVKRCSRSSSDDQMITSLASRRRTLRLPRKPTPGDEESTGRRGVAVHHPHFSPSLQPWAGPHGTLRFAFLWKLYAKWDLGNFHVYSRSPWWLWHTADHLLVLCCRWPRCVWATGCAEAGHCRLCTQTPRHCPPLPHDQLAGRLGRWNTLQHILKHTKKQT